MTFEDYFIDSIINDETYGGKPELKVYPDPSDEGHLTYGFGHKLTEEEKKYMKEGDPITYDHAVKTFKQDLSNTFSITNRLPWIQTLSDGQKFTLLDMSFNMGEARMRGTAPRGFTRFFDNMYQYSQSETKEQKRNYSHRAYMELKHVNPFGINGKKDMSYTKYWKKNYGGRAHRNAQYILDPSKELIKKEK